jgi:sugar/nucleoside kinase (ribokinase family)
MLDWSSSMQMAKIPKLVCLGNFTIDNVYLPDKTYKLNCSGGNAFYASLGGRLWEPNTEIVAPIGYDYPEELMRQIINAKLSLIGLPKRSVATVRNDFFYNEKGERTGKKLTSEADLQLLSPRPEDIPEEYYGAEIFLVSAMTLKAQMDIVSWIKANLKGLVALDIREGYISGNEQSVLDMIAKVDIFMPSEVEVVNLLHTRDWSQAAKEFSTLGPRLVVIKRGSEGSLIYDADHRRHIEVPSYKTHVIDSTGAGDSYCGGFLAKLIRKPTNLEEAGRAGAISSSFTISGWGAEGILNATPNDAEKRIKEWETRLSAEKR